MRPLIITSRRGKFDKELRQVSLYQGGGGGGEGGVRWTNVVTMRRGKIDKEFRQVSLYRGEGGGRRRKMDKCHYIEVG